MIKRKILFYFWHRIDESEADKTERLEKWQKYLENEDAKKEIAEKNQHSEGAADDTGSKCESPEIAEIGSSWNTDLCAVKNVFVSPRTWASEW